ncbi:50S ribosomal protein L15 [Candidatus Marinamargulisbacteria bacterium SCGC AG-343-D04]|nr:50S ribosomal protein L15 [Candidatus Marinamargulisbacteria bacterium SCGC AG-343-D04]
MTLAFLKPKNKKNRKRRGRGNASGLGGECGRGHKGQKSRSGYSRRAGFEGGQMPLFRRIPKSQGFNNDRFKTYYDLVNLSQLDSFDEGSEITLEFLFKEGLVTGKYPIKILANGTIKKKLNVSAHAFSKTAIEKIEKLKGTCNLVQYK